MKLDVGDERVVQLLAAWGVPYVYGAGAPKDLLAWPKGVLSARAPASFQIPGWDCSGFFQVALVQLGLLASSAPDRSAAVLFAEGQKVDEISAQLGDGAFYGNPGIEHVMLYLGGGAVLGARGGTSQTYGQDPRAFVQLERVRYRSDFAGFRRVRS